MAEPTNPKKCNIKTATYPVLRLINEGHSASKIGKLLGFPRYTMSKFIARLRANGLVMNGIRTSFKELTLTETGKLLLRELQQVLKGSNNATLKSFPVEFRRHHVLLRIPILYRQPEIESIFQKKGAIWKQRGPQNIRGWEVRINSHPVMLTGKSILIFPQPVRAPNIHACVLESFKIMETIRRKIMRWAPYLQLAEKTEVCRQHLAMVGGFTELIPAGFKYQSDRLVIDYSTGKAELEGINKTFAVEDMQVLMQHFEAIVRGEMVLPKPGP